jgi:MraZ protein
VLALGIERNVDVYPIAGWQRNVERIAELDSFSREARDVKRYVFPSTTVTELDAQGRVLLPQKLVQRAGLGRDVIVAGVHEHVEIWNRDRWEAHREEIEGSVSDVAERLADKRG